MNTKQRSGRAKAKIERVWIEHKPDDSPDYSHLGKLTSHSGNGWYLDRKTGKLLSNAGLVLAADVPTDYNRHEFEYITDFQSTGGESSWNHVDDKGVCSAFLHCRYTGNHGELKHQKNLFTYFQVTGWTTAATRKQKIRVLDIVYTCLACYRLYRLFKDDFSYIGVIAKAEYVSAAGISQTIRSGGLWGIESDSGNYLQEVGKEQLEELRDELLDAGFSTHAINRAFKTVETINK